MLTTILIVVAFFAGMQNALAGGGSFLVFPSLLLFGLDARSANITSTMALFPGQIASGLTGRRLVRGAEGLRVSWLVGLSLAGGAVGAVLLLATPASIFEKLVPFLVLFATGVFAWGSFFRKPDPAAKHLGPGAAAAVQFVIAIYGGYFGGGIGFLMLAALTLAGLDVRSAGATKNVLAGVMNASAVLIFAFSHQVHWWAAAAVGAGALVGGQIGVWMLTRVDDRVLRIVATAIGAALTVGLFWRAYA